MDLKKMALISFTTNIIVFFLLFSVAIIPGLNLVGVPFIIVGIVGMNLIMLLVCLFTCKMPHPSSKPAG